MILPNGFFCESRVAGAFYLACVLDMVSRPHYRPTLPPHGHPTEHAHRPPSFSLCALSGVTCRPEPWDESATRRNALDAC